MVLPAVSVVIPTFNRSWGLTRAVESVLAQTFADFELVITDDTSPDDTETVARSFSDPRVRYHRQPANVGVARNWGTGIELARGEFVALLMDDDRYEPDFLARRVAALRADPAAVLAFAGYRIVPEDGDRPAWEFDPGYGGPRTLTGTDFFHAALSRRVFVGATLYRTAAVRRVWAAAEQVAEIVDYALNLALARLPGAAGVYLGGGDFVMSEHPGQVSVSRLAPIFPMAERFHRELLADGRLPPPERRLVRDELRTWYLQWGKYEGRPDGRPGRAIQLVGRAIRMNPLALPGWKLAARIGWGAAVNAVLGTVRRPLG
ncbi:MAG TPA: glycosyltransferase family 2 protein [Gemmataceae bacterium]|jgi:glycosyltransferase involved in cell wall biosynthesis|nr:glycosyltransferase family 2 protein [Gemmataceae bacterium]